MEIRLQPRVRCVLVILGDEMPEPAADELCEKAAGVCRAHEARPFGGGNEGQPLMLTSADKALCLCLLEEREEPASVAQIFGNDVA